MQPAYAAATAESGSGSYARMKDGMVAHVQVGP
jgi:hypothetical protein